MVLDISKTTWFQVLKQKTHTTIRIKGVNLPQKSFKKLKKYRDTKIQKIHLKREESDLILIVDHPKVNKLEYFTLNPNKKYPFHRLVIDLYHSHTKDSASYIKSNKKIIVIDPGHGGEDPGAIGYKGNYEKYITLSIAKKLTKKINQLTNYHAILTRVNDYYVPLTKRIRLAQKYKADLFISIHADAVHNKKARGSSVYTLSKRGASTKFAKQLEQSENASDKFGGVNNLKKQDNYLKQILVDFSRSNRQKESIQLAQAIINQLKKVNKVHKTTPQKANFVVLKSPAIPSILIETAFISNPNDEYYLTSKIGQQQIVNAIFNGIQQYGNQQK